MSIRATRPAKTEISELLRIVREDQVPPGDPSPSYEDEGSDLVSRGSVTLPSGGCWSASVEVRMGAEQGALLTVNRSGSGAGPAPTEASLMIPPGEADALLALLTGLIRQARSDGVLEGNVRHKRARGLRSESPPPDSPDTND